MFCTKCGARCADSSRFCEKCGSPLTPPSPPPQPKVELRKEPAQDLINDAFGETPDSVRSDPFVPPAAPVSQPVSQPFSQPIVSQPAYRPVPPPAPVQRKSGGAVIAAAVILLLAAAVGVGGFFLFRTRAENEMDLEGNLAQYMWDYCLPDIENHYDDVLPKRFSDNGYTIGKKDSSFRIQPAKKKDAYTVSGRFDVTDKTRDGVTCRVNVEGTVTTDFMRSKYTWDLDYDFEDPPAVEEPPAQPDGYYTGEGYTPEPGWGDMPTEPPEYYIWPTDTQYITYNDLYGYSRYEIMLMRNELYARYGCYFQDEEIRSYFLDQSWYTPNVNMLAVEFSIDQFSDIERANLETILNYERDMGWRK